MREEKGREGSGEGREMRREPEDVDNGKKTYGDEGSLEEVTGGGGASLGLGVAIGDSGLKKKTRRDATRRKGVSTSFLRETDERERRSNDDLPSARASWRQGQRRYRFLGGRG